MICRTCHKLIEVGLREGKQFLTEKETPCPGTDCLGYINGCIDCPPGFYLFAEEPKKEGEQMEVDASVREKVIRNIKGKISDRIEELSKEMDRGNWMKGTSGPYARKMAPGVTIEECNSIIHSAADQARALVWVIDVVLNECPTCGSCEWPYTTEEPGKEAE